MAGAPRTSATGLLRKRTWSYRMPLVLRDELAQKLKAKDEAELVKAPWRGHCDAPVLC